MAMFIGGRAFADFELEEGEAEYASPKKIEEPEEEFELEEKSAEPTEEKEIKSDGKSPDTKEQIVSEPIEKKTKPKKEEVKPKNTKKENKKSSSPSQGTKAKNAKKPIKLKSEGLRGSRSNGKIFLKENVKIEQGDLVITCDDATVYFDEKKDEIEKVVASGNVKLRKNDPMTKSNLSAEARQVTYEQNKGILTLTGNVSISRAGDVIKGKTLIYDMNSGWITGKQVDGLVKPKSN